jgi:hypothetical protein
MKLLVADIKKLLPYRALLALLLTVVQFLPIFALAQSGEVYIYPSKGQSSEQQDKDRYECHRWAVQQTGFDPSKMNASNPNYLAGR